MNKTSNFHRFFVLLLLVPAITMIVGSFFDIQIVGNAYFVALLILISFFIIDKHYGTILTNYRITFFLTDLINIIAVATILAYVYNKEITVDVCLIAVIVIEAIMIILNLFFTKNENITKYFGAIVDTVKIGSIISILAYFYKVSTFWFAIDALIFELVSLGFKIYFAAVHKKVEEKEISENEKIEELIHSAGEDEGETE